MRVNKAQLSDVLGVSEVTLTEWQKEDPPLPIAVAGRKRGQAHVYDTAVVIDWLMARRLSKSGVTSPRDRLYEIQAEEAELRVAEKRGHLVPVDQVEPMWNSYVQAARQYLRAVVPRLAQLLEQTEGREAKHELLCETVDEFLTKLAGLDPDNDSSASGKTNDKVQLRDLQDVQQVKVSE